MEKSVASSIWLVGRKQFRNKENHFYPGFAQDLKLFIITFCNSNKVSLSSTAIGLIIYLLTTATARETESQ